MIKEMNANLTQKYTKEEIVLVIKSMHPTKALGPDGMPAIFFQKFWNIIGGDVTKLCLDMLNGDSQISDINKTHIVLIPKIKEPRQIS